MSIFNSLRESSKRLYSSEEDEKKKQKNTAAAAQRVVFQFLILTSNCVPDSQMRNQTNEKAITLGQVRLLRGCNKFSRKIIGKTSTDKVSLNSSF